MSRPWPYRLDVLCTFPNGHQPLTEELRNRIEQLDTSKLPASLSSIPTHFSLSDRLSPCEEQGERGTCAAFAATAAMELFHQRDLSEQHFYHLAIQRQKADGYTFEGLATPYVDLVMRTDGVVDGPIWKYDPVYDKTNITHAPPPKAVNSSPKFRSSGLRSIDTKKGSASAILCKVLHQNQVPIYASTPTQPQAGWKFGPRISNDNNPPKEAANHAVLLCGYSTSGQVILFMNSWGYRWGFGGFGFATFDYVDRHFDEAYLLLP